MMPLLPRLARRAALAFLLPAAAAAAEPPPFGAATVSGLGARNIGSATMSGRIAALAATRDATGRTVLYVGAASGGVWKSLDGGTTFRPVFDEQPVQSIGAVALDPGHPSTVWVGTGEAWTRNSVSIGDGVYKSVDGGDTWQHMGLPDSERIAKILVSPRDGETVYACVAGKLWSDSAERGLYKTTDGGRSWKLVLAGANLSTGCAGIALDPENPDVVFAALWDFRRRGWTFRSGGESAQAPSGSALMRSADGGATWTEISPATHPGFAAKPYGRIAVAVAPSDAKRVYAFVESPDSALYVSEDGGATWQQRDKSRWMVWRSFYFANLVVDPKNPDRVFKTDGALIESTDGGRSFSAVGGFVGMHGDVHDAWIDPANPQEVVAGDDGGLWFSHNGGSKWWKGGNLPVSQFYHVSVDDAPTYRVYGGLQDNGSWVAPSQYPGGIGNDQWESLYFGDGFWTFPDPADPAYVYAEAQGGTIGRVRLDTHETRDIQPRLAPADQALTKKLRFNWNTPIALSPNARGTIYIGSQFLHRSRDHGRTWERISPDLTTNDPAHQLQEQSGGVTVDNSAAEMYETIFSISESPRDARVIWAGTDDGRLQVTRDGGAHWHDTIGAVPGLPKAAWVNWVQASAFEAGTAYAAFDLHTFGDPSPWVYRTRDFGRSWTPLVTPADAKGVRGWAHVVKEDPKARGLLYLGTEFGLWISVDDGRRWAQFKGGRLPAVAVRDLAFQPRTDDLVLATHGRGLWIVDDISPLRALPEKLLRADVAFAPSRPAVQRLRAYGGAPAGDAVFVGDNPKDGAVITYYQSRRHLYGPLKLEVFDAAGRRVADLPAGKRPGLNRVVWNMLERPPRVPPAAQLAEAGTQGPRVLPGVYKVRLTDNGKSIETRLDVVLDPRATFTLADRRAQHAAAVRARALFGEESALMARVLALRADLAARAASGSPPPALLALRDRVDAIRKEIVATTEGGAITGEERLREHTDQLYGALLGYEGRPAAYQLANLELLEGESERIGRAFDALLAKELPGVNRALVAAGQPAIAAPAAEKEDEDDDADGPGSANPAAGGIDPDALSAPTLPAGFRPLR
jgi:photosystem II stability/assembly factor-like uncharacterized protein